MKGKILIYLTLNLLFSVGIAKDSSQNLLSDQSFFNFNDPNTKRLVNTLNSKRSLKVVQIGDSHTAADFFTGYLRKEFQNSFGDGGYGWISPAQIPGNRYDNVLVNSSNWKIVSALKKSGNKNFPLGGFIAQSKEGNLRISRSGKIPNEAQAYSVWLLYNNKSKTSLQISSGNSKNYFSLPSSKEWNFVKLKAQYNIPINLKFSSNETLNLGGVYIQSEKQKGAVLSAMGINGATIYTLENLNEHWYEPLSTISSDLVILAFGTNEANQSSFEKENFKKSYAKTISQIRGASPKAAILLIGPPDSMKSVKSMNNVNPQNCSSQQLINLKKVQSSLKEIAVENHVMLWDWANAMGGDCSIAKWKKSDLAANHIHLTRNGYAKSARLLLQDMSATLKLKQSLTQSAKNP